MPLHLPSNLFENSRINNIINLKSGKLPINIVYFYINAIYCIYICISYLYINKTVTLSVYIFIICISYLYINKAVILSVYIPEYSYIYKYIYIYIPYIVQRNARYDIYSIFKFRCCSIYNRR